VITSNKDEATWAMGATVLQLGEVPRPLAEALTAKYDAVVLPINPGRDDFLAEHGASVRGLAGVN